MTERELKRIEEIIGYHFRNPALLRQAFTRASYINEVKQAKMVPDTDSNEVLEFIGDSVLSACLAALLARSLGKVTDRGFETALNEGDLSIIKSNLSDKTALAARTDALALAPYMRQSRGDYVLGVSRGDSPKEDLFESIIGAVALDSGMDYSILIPLVERLDDPRRLTHRREVVKDAKTRLKEYCEKRGLAYSFKVTAESGPDHDKRYTVSAEVGGKSVAEGSGKSTKRAATAAAEAALAKLHES